MKPDIYTKAVLTVIALMLTAIASKPLISPNTAVSAQSAQFGGVVFTGGNTVASFFDPRSGEIWLYGGFKGSGQLAQKLRLTRLGQPLTVEVDNMK